MVTHIGYRQRTELVLFERVVAVAEIELEIKFFENY
jgi:hypothetical protein